jgi:hypothetical protein
MPKFERSYFVERLQTIGNDKATKAFMNKMRLVYKGLEVFDDFQALEEEIMQKEQQKLPEAPPPMFEYINTVSSSSRPEFSGKPLSSIAFKLMDPQGGLT